MRSRLTVRQYSSKHLLPPPHHHQLTTVHMIDCTVTGYLSCFPSQPANPKPAAVYVILFAYGGSASSASIEWQLCVLSYKPSTHISVLQFHLVSFVIRSDQIRSQTIMSSSKRRRIIDDDDDDDKNDAAVDDGKSTVMRMLRNTKKSQKVRMTKSSTEKTEKTAPTIDEGGIPRKLASRDTSRDNSPRAASDEIPKKPKPTLLTQTEEVKNKKTTLLTQSMVQAAAAAPRGGTITTTSTGQQKNHGHSRSKIFPSRLPQLSPVIMMDPTFESMPQLQQQQQLLLLQQQQSPSLRDEERRVLSTLKNLCSKVNLHILPTDDLLSGTFLENNSGGETTILDQNALGEIILPARIPIFPEDFAGGQASWPLSWWGIVDPLVKEEINKQQQSRRQSSTPKKGSPTKESSDSRGRGRELGDEKSDRKDVRDTSDRGGDQHSEKDRPSDRRRSGEGPDRDRDRRRSGEGPDRDHDRRRSGGEGSSRGDPDRRRSGGDGPPRGEQDRRRGGGGPPPNWDHQQPPDHDRRGPWNDRRMGPPPGDSRGPPQQRGPPPRY